MGYWDEKLDGSRDGYPYHHYLSFRCCPGKVQLKIIFGLIGAFAFVKTLMLMLVAGFGKLRN